jgi:voltage-gated potassium channel
VNAQKAILKNLRIVDQDQYKKIFRSRPSVSNLKAFRKHAILERIEYRLKIPMLFLSFVWFFIIITELVYGMTPVFLWLGTGIWILFVLFFLLKLVAFPKRLRYLKRNWIFIFAILVPILRFVPILQSFTWARALMATSGLQIVWIFASADIGLRSLRTALGKRGAGYAIALTIVIIFVGAAGMLSFERDALDPLGIHSYPKALWWTAMQMTNIGTSYRATTVGGELVCLGISVYAAAMFGYLTAILATFLIDLEAKDPGSEIASQKSIREVHEELVSLKNSIEKILRHVSKETNSIADGP